MRNFRLASILILLISISLFSFGQYKQIDAKIPEMNNPGIVPYVKYQLDNGLTVIVSEAPSSSNVSIDFSYRFGSAVSYTDQTGMANIIGQLLFEVGQNEKGYSLTDFAKFSGGNSFQIVTKDMIKQKIQVNSNLTEYVLWYLAENIGQFNSNLDQKKFDDYKKSFKAVCQNKSVLQQDYILNRVIYPNKHPYSWNPQGDPEQYDKIQLNDVKHFFSDWFGVNNAVLTIAGGVDTTIIKLIDQYFGKLPKAKYTHTEYAENVSYIEKNIAAEKETRLIASKTKSDLNKLVFVYDASSAYSENEEFFTIAAYILNDQSNANPLYNALINSKYAKSCNAKYNANRFSGEFLIEVEYDSASQTENIRKRVMNSMDKIFSLSGTPDRMAYGYISKIIFDYLQTKQGAEEKSVQDNVFRTCMLSKGEIFNENPHEYLRFLNFIKFDYPTLSKKAIELKMDHPKQILYFVPETAPVPKVYENLNIEKYKPIEEHASAFEAVQNDKLKEPEFKKLKSANPEFEETSFENGVKIVKFKSTQGNLVELSFRFQVNEYESDFENLLISNMIAQLLKGSFETINQQPGPLADMSKIINIESYADFNNVYLNIGFDKIIVDPGILIELLSGFILTPQKPFINPHGYIQNLNSGAMMEEIGNELMYLGLSNPVKELGIIKNGPAAHIEDYDLKSFEIYQALMEIGMMNLNRAIVPANTTLLIKGAHDQMIIENLEMVLKAWEVMVTDESMDKIPGEANAKEKKSKGIYLFDNEGAKKHELMIGYHQIKIEDPAELIYADFINYYLSTLLNKDSKNFTCKFNKEEMPISKNYLSSNASFYIEMKTTEDLSGIIQRYQDEIGTLKRSKIPRKDLSGLKSYFLYAYLSNDYLGESNLNSINSEEVQKLINKIKRGKLKKFANQKLEEDKLYILNAGNKKAIESELKGKDLGNMVEVNDFGQEIK